MMIMHLLVVEYVDDVVVAVEEPHHHQVGVGRQLKKLVQDNTHTHRHRIDALDWHTLEKQSLWSDRKCIPCDLAFS